MMVMVIGIKLIIDWTVNTPADPNRVDFQDPRGAAMWVFWAAMVVSLGTGVWRGKRGKSAES
jgi:hypothetical protein